MSLLVWAIREERSSNVQRIYSATFCESRMELTAATVMIMVSTIMEMKLSNNLILSGNLRYQDMAFSPSKAHCFTLL